MINKLTPAQKAQIAVYRDRYFALATSIEPADRPRAEAAARRLFEIADVTVDRIVWAASPEESCAICKRGPGSCLRPSTFQDSLRLSLWDSFSDALWKSLRESILETLGSSLRDALTDSFWKAFRNTLANSPWTSFLASPVVALNSFIVEVLGVPCSKREREVLSLQSDLLASCFGLWSVPDAVILCERPAAVEVVDGRLVGATWRTAP